MIRSRKFKILNFHCRLALFENSYEEVLIKLIILKETNGFNLKLLN